ncbi:MAG TPA: hypothetical protein VE197_05695, partial [Mycobacterium sp.]|nr:hypothetical protein [Mycobacterium sp.]
LPCRAPRSRSSRVSPKFHALYDKVLYRRDVLGRAWESVRANRGAAGIDRQTIAGVEQYGSPGCLTSQPRI